MVIDELFMKIRQEEFLREVARYRLISQAKKRGLVIRNNSHNKALAGLGSRLCKWGSLLQNRFGNSEKVTSYQSTNRCIKA